MELDRLERTETPEQVRQLLEAIPELSQLPLGVVSLAQRLIDVRANAPHLLAPLYEDGVPMVAQGSLVGTLLAFLAPDASSASQRRTTRRYQEKVLASQQSWPDLAAAQGSTYLVCFDAEPDHGLPRQLYLNPLDRELVSWPTFSQLLSQLIALTSGGNIARADPLLQAALTTVLFELFKNTEDHARHEIDGADVQSSVRGIYAQYWARPATHKKSGKEVHHSSPGQAFLDHTLEPKRTRGTEQTLGARGVLEISVFDSGPGMAARWAGRDVSGETASAQMAYLLSCFQKGQTSTTAAARGFGLWKVLRSIEVRGFIAVRTHTEGLIRPSIKARTRQLPPSVRVLCRTRCCLIGKWASLRARASFHTFAGPSSQSCFQ